LEEKSFQQTLVRESAVPRGSIRQKSVKRLQGFGGSIVETKECILTSVKTERSKIYIHIHIVPDDILPYDVLMGRDLLCSKVYEQIGNSNSIMQAEESAINFNIRANVSSSQRNEVSYMLHRYTDCFAEDLSHIGRCNTTVMDIEVTTATPILGRRYQVAFSKRDALRSQLDLLLKHNIISKSSSPYASSAILVPKAKGESRLCIEYRALNAVTVKKRYPMPIVEEQLAKLSGNSYFTTLDMTSGYYQIPMGQESKKFTPFLTPDGLYEFNVMPFGLLNAPMVFQEVIMDLLRQLEHQRNIISYVDEVIIPSKTVDEGLVILNEFLQAIRSAGLTLRPSKCSFLQSKVKFLGHLVTANGI